LLSLLVLHHFAPTLCDRIRDLPQFDLWESLIATSLLSGILSKTYKKIFKIFSQNKKKMFFIKEKYREIRPSDFSNSFYYLKSLYRELSIIKNSYFFRIQKNGITPPHG